MRRLALCTILVLAVGFGCDSKPTPSTTTTATPEPAKTAQAKPTASEAPQSDLPPLLDPKKANKEAPASFKAKFETTKGDFVVQVTRDWAPQGADRFYNLVQIGFFDDLALFRVVQGFVVQFGMHGDPKVSAVWKKAQLLDEMVKETNVKGTLTYAKAGPDTRTTQIFINLGDNTDLDKQGFSPFGKIVEGMDVVEKFYSDYGEKVSQAQLLAEGNAYLKKEFPKLDYIKKASLME